MITLLQSFPSQSEVWKPESSSWAEYFTLLKARGPIDLSSPFQPPSHPPGASMCKKLIELAWGSGRLSGKARDRGWAVFLWRERGVGFAAFPALGKQRRESAHRSIVPIFLGRHSLKASHKLRTISRNNYQVLMIQYKLDGSASKEWEKIHFSFSFFFGIFYFILFYFLIYIQVS